MSAPASPIDKSPVLVTGGGGFIGSHLAERLVTLGAQVTVADSFTTGRADNLQSVLPYVQLITGDVNDLLRSRQINLNDYAYIFHLAANPYIPSSIDNPTFDFYLNLQTTFSLLEALRQTENPPRLVYVSSAAVYGNPARLPIREIDPTVPISPYGVSKLASERYAAVYSQIYGVRATSLRLFSVYGPRQQKQVVFDLLRKLDANPQRITVYGDGSQARDFVYVADAVQAMILVATEAPGEGEVYNVSSGSTYTIAQLVTALCEVCNLSPEVVYTGQIRPGDAEVWEVDITCLKQLGFEAQTSLKEGLTAIRDWYYDTFK
jgi:UDP-glucose 4-epimerase